MLQATLITYIQFMWPNKLIPILLGFALVGCVTAPRSGDSVCPARPDSHVKAVDVYDGPIADMAILVPDEATDTEGFWRLAYVYRSGRAVNIRCKYSDGAIVEVEIKNEIGKCRYAVAKEEGLILRCK